VIGRGVGDDPRHVGQPADLVAADGPESPDPSILPSYVLGGSVVAGDTAHYSSASVNALLADGLATSDPARRLSIYRQVLTDVATDVPYVVLFSLNAYTALSTKYTLPPFSVYPAFTSWALHLKLAVRSALS
jgi:peptide/nickel transport system substrate-binding protein